MNFFPKEVTCFLIPHVVLSATNEMGEILRWSLERMLEEECATPKNTIHDNKRRGPLFRVCLSDTEAWINKWKTESIFELSQYPIKISSECPIELTSNKDTHSYLGQLQFLINNVEKTNICNISYKTIISLPWYRRVVCHIPPVIVLALDFCNYPLLPPGLWSPSQIQLAAQIKFRASQTLYYFRLSLNHFFHLDSKTTHLEAIQCPKLIISVFFDISPNGGTFSNEVLQSSCLNSTILLAELNNLYISQKNKETPLDPIYVSQQSSYSDTFFEGQIEFVLGLQRSSMLSLFESIVDASKDYYNNETRQIRNVLKEYQRQNVLKEYQRQNVWLPNGSSPGTGQFNLSPDNQLNTYTNNDEPPESNYSIQTRIINLSFRLGFLLEYTHESRVCMKQYLSVWELVTFIKDQSIDDVYRMMIATLVTSRLCQLYYIFDTAFNALKHLKYFKLFLWDIINHSPELKSLGVYFLAQCHLFLADLSNDSLLFTHLEKVYFLTPSFSPSTIDSTIGHITRDGLQNCQQYRPNDYEDNIIDSSLYQSNHSVWMWVRNELLYKRRYTRAYRLRLTVSQYMISLEYLRYIPQVNDLHTNKSIESSSSSSIAIQTIQQNHSILSSGQLHKGNDDCPNTIQTTFWVIIHIMSKLMSLFNSHHSMSRQLLIMGIHFANAFFDQKYYIEALSFYRLCLYQISVFNSTILNLKSPETPSNNLDCQLNKETKLSQLNILNCVQNCSSSTTLFHTLLDHFKIYVGFSTINSFIVSRFLLCISFIYTLPSPPSILSKIGQSVSPHILATQSVTQQRLPNCHPSSSQSSGISQSPIHPNFFHASPLHRWDSSRVPIDITITNEIYTQIYATIFHWLSLKMNLSLCDNETQDAVHSSLSPTQKRLALPFIHLYKDSVVALNELLSYCKLMSETEFAFSLKNQLFTGVDQHQLTKLFLLLNKIGTVLFDDNTVFPVYPSLDLANTRQQLIKPISHCRIYLRELFTTLSIKEIYNPYWTASSILPLTLQFQISFLHTLDYPIEVNELLLHTSFGLRQYSLVETTTDILQHIVISPIHQYTNSQNDLTLSHEHNHDYLTHSSQTTIRNNVMYVYPNECVTFIIVDSFPEYYTHLTPTNYTFQITSIDLNCLSYSSPFINMSIASRIIFPHSYCLSTLDLKQYHDVNNPRYVTVSGIIHSGFLSHLLWPPFDPRYSNCFTSRPMINKAVSFKAVPSITWPMTGCSSQFQLLLSMYGFLGYPTPIISPTNVRRSIPKDQSPSPLIISSQISHVSSGLLDKTIEETTVDSIGDTIPLFPPGTSEWGSDTLFNSVIDTVSTLPSLPYCIPLDSGQVLIQLTQQTLLNDPNTFLHMTIETPSFTGILGKQFPIVIHLSYIPIPFRISPTYCILDLNGVKQQPHSCESSLSNDLQQNDLISPSFYCLTTEDHLLETEDNQFQLTESVEHSLVLHLPTSIPKIKPVPAPLNKVLTTTDSSTHVLYELKPNQSETPLPQLHFIARTTEDCFISDSFMSSLIHPIVFWDDQTIQNDSTDQFSTHKTFESTFKRIGMEVFRVSIPVYMNVPMIGTYQITTSLQLFQKNCMIGQYIKQCHVETIEPFSCCFRALPMYDPSLADIFNNRLQQQQQVPHDHIYSENSSQLLYDTCIPMSTNAHCQLLSTTIKNNSEMCVSINEIMMTHKNEKNQHISFPIYSPTLEASSLHYIFVNSLNSTVSNTINASSFIVNPGGQWSCAIDLSHFKKQFNISNYRDTSNVIGDTLINDINSFYIEIHYSFIYSFKSYDRSLSLYLASCYESYTHQSISKYVITPSEISTLSQVSSFEVLSSHQPIATVGTPFSFIVVAVNNTRKPQTFHYTLVYPPTLGLPISQVSKESISPIDMTEITQQDQLKQHHQTISLGFVPPPPPIQGDIPLFIGGMTSGTLFIPPLSYERLQWIMLPLNPGILSLPTIFFRTLDVPIPITFSPNDNTTQYENQLSLQSFLQTYYQSQHMKHKDEDIIKLESESDMMMNDNKECLDVFVSPHSQMTILPDPIFL